MDKIDLLSKRLDVLQNEIREALQAVNSDFHTVLRSMMSAMAALDERINVLESAKPKLKTEEGKEL